jgi:PadR family transcriptional regulator, regulatory protein AphA
MSLKYGILGLLSYGNMTGYDISKCFKDSVGYFWNAQQSQIYRELAALEKEGLVEHDLVIQSDKPNKKLYQLNDLGRRRLIEWLGDEHMDDYYVIRNPLLLKLFFSSKVPVSRAISMLTRYKEKCELEARQLAANTCDLSAYETQIENPHESLYWRMTIAYGLGNYQFSAQWAQDCIDILEKRKEAID